VKHPSLKGWRLLVVQPLTVDGGPDGEPLLAIDGMGASIGSPVIITSDGKAVSEAMGTNSSPVRWMVLAQPD
jgi:ethanolamine utilization protein EutN